MLYERWESTAKQNGQEIAIEDLPSGRKWTFRELHQLGESHTESVPEILYLETSGIDLFIRLLWAWKHGIPVCPIEPGQKPLDLPTPPRHIAHLKTTSATTGIMRVVAFTEEQLAADATNIVETMNLRADWPNVGVISLAHSYGFSNLVTPLLLHGIPLVLAGSGLPEAVRSACQSRPGVTLPAVPALWRAWHEAKVLDQSIKLAISAGAALPVSLEQGVHEDSGIKLHNFYGATECGGIAFDSSELPRTDPGKIGTALANVQLEINEEGLLCVEGDAVGDSYWPQVERTLQNRRFVTSDLVTLEEGAVTLIGREGDQINVAGRKVSPDVIEETLASHPKVKQCIVFGVPSRQPERGEEIVACLRADENDPAVLRNFLAHRIQDWKLPKHWWFVSELTTTSRGKLSRSTWREKFLASGRLDAAER